MNYFRNAYELLRTLGVVANQEEFSEKICCKPPTWFRDIKYRGQVPDDQMRECLFRKLSVVAAGIRRYCPKSQRTIYKKIRNLQDDLMRNYNYRT